MLSSNRLILHSKFIYGIYSKIRKRSFYHQIKINITSIVQLLEYKKKIAFFMENHVFAVWDFMSLIKALQINLTCVDVPWTPNKNNLAGKLVNEIVLAEESDVDPSGNPKSHFELYLDSMQFLGADTKRIKDFISNINHTKSYEKSITKMNLPQPVKEFMDFTFEIINSKKSHNSECFYIWQRGFDT